MHVADEVEKKRGGQQIIANAAEFDLLVMMYLARIEEEREPITLTGLILGLGLSSRASLDHYQKQEEFHDSVKRAKLFVEHGYELLCARGGAGAGPIFVLKNFGWTDKSIHELQGAGGGPVATISLSTEEYINARKKMLAEDDC